MPRLVRHEVPIRLARTMLFVPASNAAMIAKAAASDADAVCLDLEDSVAPNAKAAARINAIEAFRTLDFGGRTRIVRVNSVDTPYTYRDLVEVIEAAGEQIDLIMLPKAEGAADVEFVDTLLTQIELSHGLARRIGIEAQIESAAGFVNAREIASASARMEALIFGPGDYAASMQMPAGAVGEMDAHDALYPGHRWHAAMHTVVATARANGLRAMDGPFAGFRDAAGFEQSCRIARAMGFDGKQCIHPAQLEAAKAIFMPGEEESAHARRVVEACETAAAAGRGAANLDGKMIDAASYRMALAVLKKLPPKETGR
ncbi:MAG: CoA ester lyase [Bryobacteraceae bacterium]